MITVWLLLKKKSKNYKFTRRRANFAIALGAAASNLSMLF